MNTFSHIMIGNLLCEYVAREYGIRLDRRSFIRGNYWPDFSIGLIIKPHYLRHKLPYVEREIAALARARCAPDRVDRRRSKRLGVICHYVADFFCLAHNDGFSHNMAVHVDYERRLHRFLAARRGDLRALTFPAELSSGADPRAISARFMTYLADYRKVGPAMGNDIVFCLQVCVETIVALMLCAQSPAPEGAVPATNRQGGYP